jgi:cytochrome d ubiquinol oxidase subunit II
MMTNFLALAWFGLLAVTLGLFVILDGADLGIGVLSLAARNEKERSIMVAAIGPMWYANETWLVIAGAILFGAFPLAYGALLSSLYIPVMALLFGLVFRAVSIEFRVHSSRKRLWGTIFGAGSALAILAQGFILGGLLSGMEVEGGQFAGSAWDWLNPTSILVAAGIVSGYTMLGAAHMVRRTEGEYQRHYRRLLVVSASASVGAFIAVIAVLPFASPAISRVWIEPPRPYVASVFFAGALLGFIMLLTSARRAASERSPHAWAVVVFICSACAVVSAIFPYFIPLSITIAEAAAPPQTLVFMLAGVGIILPIIAVYNLYARGVFRGKVRGDDEEDY